VATQRNLLIGSSFHSWFWLCFPLSGSHRLCFLCFRLIYLSGTHSGWSICLTRIQAGVSVMQHWSSCPPIAIESCALAFLVRNLIGPNVLFCMPNRTKCILSVGMRAILWSLQRKPRCVQGILIWTDVESVTAEAMMKSYQVGPWRLRVRLRDRVRVMVRVWV
jgi:hypothetical protein